MFATVLNSLNTGFLKTLELFLLTLAGALPLGLLIAFGSMSKWAPFRSLRRFRWAKPWLTELRPVQALVRLVIWVVRGTPLMLQLLIIYYGPGLMGNNIWGGGESGRFLATVVAFVFNYACYLSEIYRGGIESIPVGQYEAGQVLGMTKRQIFVHVTLLQVIKRILPPISNEIITLVKDTSLSRIIALQEIIWAGQAFMKSDGLIWPLFFTGLYYLLFSGLLTILLRRLEKKLNYFRA